MVVPGAVDIMTDPYPGFPTDLQAQVMAYMTRVDGASMITETIFENRFMHVPELNRMGANINVHNSTALIRGVNKLHGSSSYGNRLTCIGLFGPRGISS